MKKKIMNLAAALIQFILVFFLIAYLMQDLNIFPGAVSSFLNDVDSSKYTPKFAKESTLTTIDDKRLTAWHMPAEDPKGIVILFHGNASFLHYYIDIYELFLKQNISVFSLNYRGYGKSTGWPSESGIYKDAEAAIEHVVNVLNYPEQDIILFGHSLGTSAASYLASKYGVSTLILISPLMSIPDVVYDATIFWPISSLVWTKFPVKNYVAETKANKVILAHGTKDNTIPFSHSEKLFELIPDGIPKEFIRVNQAHHNNTLSTRMLEKTIFPRLSPDK